MNLKLSVLAVTLVIVEILIILASWLITAAMPEISLRSLLSSEGIRWFFGQFSFNLASPTLAWLVLAMIGVGAVRESKMLAARHEYTYRERFALTIVVIELLLIVAVMSLLTLLPQAVLTNIEGELFPSSFSWSLIPVICFALSLASVTYVWVSGRIENLDQVFDILTIGLRKYAGWFLIYILLNLVYNSACFVFQ